MTESLSTVSALQPILQAVADIARGLTSLTNEHSAQIQGIEQALINTGASIDCTADEPLSIDSEPASPGSSTRRSRAGYFMFDGTRGTSAHFSVGEDVSLSNAEAAKETTRVTTKVTFLIDTSRDTRLAALKQMPNVLAAYHCALQQKLALAKDLCPPQTQNSPPFFRLPA
ncbi:MAG: hypothetical protein ACHQ7N_09630 [Candidatus Methylomirabilales bacterium]